MVCSKEIYILGKHTLLSNVQNVERKTQGAVHPQKLSNNITANKYITNV